MEEGVGEWWWDGGEWGVVSFVEVIQVGWGGFEIRRSMEMLSDIPNSCNHNCQ